MNFEFDPKKAASNLRKHGVAFAEVEPVFYDNLALTQVDDGPHNEPRFVTAGIDVLGRVLAVCWTERDGVNGHVIRLISVRLATTHERKLYEN